MRKKGFEVSGLPSYESLNSERFIKMTILRALAITCSFD